MNEQPQTLKHLSVMVSVALLAQVRRLAVSEGRALSQTARRLLEEALAAREVAHG